MKKLAILFMFFFAGIITLQAQPRLSSEGVVIPVFGRTGYPNITISDRQGEYTGLLRGPTSSRKYTDKEGNNSAIIRFNNSSAEMSQSKFGIDRNYDIQTFFNGKETVTGIYSKYDRKEDIYAIYKDILPLAGNKHKSDPKLLANFSLASRDGKFTYFASSPDNTKHVFALVVTDRKKNFKGLFVHVMNENGEKEWEKELLPQFPHKNFDLQDITITPKGEILMLLNSFNLEKRAKLAETIHILRIFENEEEMYDVKFPFRSIYEMKMKYIEENDKVVIAGFYAQSDKDHATNLFSLTFNQRTRSFTEFDKKNLANLAASNSKGNIFAAIGTKNFDYRCLGMELLENGDVCLLGEQYYFYTSITTNSKGYSKIVYNYDFRNIIISFVSNEGNILNTEKIEKSQFISRDWPLSRESFSKYGLGYDYFVQGSDVYVIFNDLINNYTGKYKSRRLYVFSGKYKQTCTMVGKISNDNKINLHMVNRYDNMPTYFQRLINHNPEKRTAVLLYEDKKAYSLRFLNY